MEKPHLIRRYRWRDDIVVVAQFSKAGGVRDGRNGRVEPSEAERAQRDVVAVASEDEGFERVRSGGGDPGKEDGSVC